MRLSVVLPCFGVAPFVERAIRSVDFADCEIIAVNDGSTDDTLSVLRALSRELSNLKIIDQKNAGASAARNAGLAVAKGEYIAFLDGDDFFEKGALAKLFALADETSADIVFGDFNYFYDDSNLTSQASKARLCDEGCERPLDPSKVMRPTTRTEFSGSNLKKPAKNYICAEGLIDKYKYFADFCTGRDSALPAVWGKIIKSNLIKENGLKFLEGVFVAEDVNFSAKAIFAARKIAKLNKPVINYRIGANNASKVFKFQHFADARACADDLREYFSKFKLTPEQAAQISAHNLILRYGAALSLPPFSFPDYEKAARFATEGIATAPRQSGFALLPRRLQILIKARIMLGFALYSNLLGFVFKLKNLISNLKS